jgi:hypothetical protein
MPCSSTPGSRMAKAILTVAMCSQFAALHLAAQQEQTFKGEIKDAMCTESSAHTPMPEKNDTHCNADTVSKGARFVLVNPDEKTVYQLDEQKRLKAFAGAKVVVVGILDKASGIIQVTHIVRAMPPQVTQAKTVYVLCDACLRGMAAAKEAAFEELADWGRYEILPDRRKADLIFLFSANPYLGDYVTRDGPDTRQVHVDITYLNVIDPRTGESLWGDSRQWGSWFVARATKDLIAHFRDQLEVGETQADKLLLKMDTDHDGGVTKEEFLRFMDAEFDRLDTDKNGKLDADELKQLRVVDVAKHGDD